MFLSFSFLFLLFAKARQGLQLLEILNSKQCLLHMEKKQLDILITGIKLEINKQNYKLPFKI